MVATFGSFLVIGLLFHLPLSPASGGHRKPIAPCGPSHTKTLSENGGTRIYRLTAPRSAQGVYACLRGSGPALRLGPVLPNTKKISAASMVGPFGVAAPWVGGIEERKTGQDGFLAFAASRNLRTGASRHCLVVGANHPFSMPEKLLISHNGNTAWGVTLPGTSGTVEIGACTAAGKRIVASGATIDPESIKLDGSILSWTDSGSTKSASI